MGPGAAIVMITSKVAVQGSVKMRALEDSVVVTSIKDEGPFILQWVAWYRMLPEHPPQTSRSRRNSTCSR